MIYGQLSAVWGTAVLTLGANDDTNNDIERYAGKGGMLAVLGRWAEMGG